MALPDDIERFDLAGRTYMTSVEDRAYIEETTAEDAQAGFSTHTTHPTTTHLPIDRHKKQPRASTYEPGARARYLSGYKESGKCWKCNKDGRSEFQFDHVAKHTKLNNGCCISSLFTSGSAREKWVFEWLITQILCGDCHNAKKVYNEDMFGLNPQLDFRTRLITSCYVFENISANVVLNLTRCGRVGCQENWLL